MEKIDIANYPSIAGKFQQIETLVYEAIVPVDKVNFWVEVKELAYLIMYIAEIVEQCIAAPGSGEKKKATVTDILIYLNDRFGIFKKLDNFILRWVWKLCGVKLLSILIDYTVETLNKTIWKK